MPHPEPRFSRIAAIIADPSRSRMLAALLSGEYRSAGELAKAAGITAQAASTQLAQLLEHGLIAMRQQGRHKYFCLADGDIARALEALAMVAERDNVSERWSKPGYRNLKHARRCYGHMAGELGVAQFEMLLRCRYLEQTDNGLQLTADGYAWLVQLGIELPARPTARLAYPCMDWSERKDHLAGILSKALLDHYVAQGWLRITQDSRELQLTANGHRLLISMLRTSPDQQLLQGNAHFATNCTGS
jgi:DNA-binding transcriptional ArsR family regulator